MSLIFIFVEEGGGGGKILSRKGYGSFKEKLVNIA